MNTSTIRFKAKEGFSDLNFLKFWLDSLEFRQQITRFVTGSAQQNFGPSHLKEIKISLPQIAEQKRIAAIAQKCDRLRRTRRYAQQLSDSYLRSVFLKMFDHQFENVLFEELLSESPKNGLYLPADKYGSGTPIIRIGNFYSGELNDASEFRRVQASGKEIDEFEVKNGDILINRVNSLEYLGKCALVNKLQERTLFESNMMRIRINRKALPDLWLKSYERLQNAARSTAETQ